MKNCLTCHYKIELLRLRADKKYARDHEIIYTKDGPRYRYIVDGSHKNKSRSR